MAFWRGPTKLSPHNITRILPGPCEMRAKPLYGLVGATFELALQQEPLPHPSLGLFPSRDRPIGARRAALPASIVLGGPKRCRFPPLSQFLFSVPLLKVTMQHALLHALLTRFLFLMRYILLVYYYSYSLCHL